MNKNQTKGKTREIKGKKKEIAGTFIDDKDIERDGQAQNAAGKVQVGIIKVKDGLKKLAGA